MQVILKKNKTLIIFFIFFLLICLCFTNQGNTFYKISIIIIVFLNLLLINYKKVKDWFSLILKKKINLFFIILLLIFFSINLYSLQILISSILALILFINFKNLDEKTKINMVYFFSYFSLFSYFFLCLFLIPPEFFGNWFSKNSYILNYDTISHLNSFSLFEGINFHNLSLFYLGIFFLKLKFFRYCFNEIKNLLIISIILDFLFIINWEYYSLIIMVLSLGLIFYLIYLTKVEYFNKIIFSILILLSLNFIYLPMILEKILFFDFLLLFEQLKNLVDLLQLKLKSGTINIDGSKYLDKMISVKEMRSIGNEFIPFTGLLNRILFYWSSENYEISILGSMNYDPFLFHSLFLEFLVNFGLAGLIILYLYLFKFFSLINTYYSKLFFLTVVALNMMDTFLFSHHYQLMLMSWIFIGLLDEKKI